MVRNLRRARATARVAQPGPPRIRSFAVAFCALSALAACGPANVSPQGNADVRSYGVALRIDPRTLRVEGHALIAVRQGAEAAREIVLAIHRSMHLHHVRVEGRPARYERDGDYLRVDLPAVPEATVDIAYSGTPETGLYAEVEAGQRVVFTDAWPQRGAGWLPAVHHPSDPASLALAIEAPSAWDVVASGVPGDVTTLPDGYRRWRFVLAHDAPVYTFAFAAADFVATSDSSGSVPVSHHLLRADSSRAFALERTGAALDTLATLLGRYPYRSFATVQVPLGFDGMENAGAVFLRAGLYRGPPRSLENVAFHEAAHQWVGNRMVPADWRDLWLAEGAATYLSTVVYERLDGPAAGRSQRIAMAAIPENDARRALRPTRLDAPGDVLSGTVYGKGGSVYHLLRLRVGDAAFFGTLRALVAAGRPVSTDEFQRSFETAAGGDLGALFRYWVHGRRVPELRTEWDPRSRLLRWRIEDDERTLAGLPIRLLIRQDGADLAVPLSAGRAVLPGSGTPEIRSDGVVLNVQ